MCAQGYISYKRCDWVVYVAAVWTPAVTSPARWHTIVQGVPIFSALAADLSAFIRDVLRCNRSANVTAYVTEYTEGLSELRVVAQILDQVPANAEADGRCIAVGLSLRLDDLQLNATSALLREANMPVVFRPGVMNVTGVTNLSAANATSPCAGGRVWCANRGPIPVPSAAPSLVWLAVVGSLLGVALLGGLAAYLLWFRPRSLFQQHFSPKEHDDVDNLNDPRTVRDITELEMALYTSPSTSQ